MSNRNEHMSNKDKLDEMLARWNARLDAHEAHGKKVHAMFVLRQSVKPGKKPSKEEYGREHAAHLAEAKALKTTSLIPFHEAARLCGLVIVISKGFKLSAHPPDRAKCSCVFCS